MKKSDFVRRSSSRRRKRGARPASSVSPVDGISRARLEFALFRGDPDAGGIECTGAGYERIGCMAVGSEMFNAKVLIPMGGRPGNKFVFTAKEDWRGLTHWAVIQDNRDAADKMVALNHYFDAVEIHPEVVIMTGKLNHPITPVAGETVELHPVVISLEAVRDIPFFVVKG